MAHPRAATAEKAVLRAPVCRMAGGAYGDGGDGYAGG
jgi:hypothetical protein